MTFPDRRAAGRELARKLWHLAGPDSIILGLPRGGLPVADEVAHGSTLWGVFSWGR